MTHPAVWSLPCPRCAGTIGILADAAALSCSFCGAAFYLAGAGGAGWIVDPETSLAEAQVAGRRWLRDAGRRVARIEEPRGRLVPFYWARGRRWKWELAPAPRPETPGFGEDAEDPLGEARLTLEAYQHALPVHPWCRLVRGGGTRFESRKLRLLDPERLPEGYAIAAPTLDREGAARLRDARLGGRARERGVMPLEARLSLVLFPLLLVPFVGRGEVAGCVVVDGVTGRVLGEAPEEIDTGSQEPLRTTLPRLLPLECADCGSPLRPRERDLLHPCPSCHAVWEITEASRLRIRQWVLEGDPGPGGRRLPFWVFGEPAADGPPVEPLFAPAYAARHPEEQVHLAARLSATPPPGEWHEPDPWPLSEASVGSREAAGWAWAVEGARSRSSLADFARFLKRSPRPAGAPQGLVWIPFMAQGGDLVEPKTGAAARARGTAPWGAERRAA